MDKQRIATASAVLAIVATVAALRKRKERARISRRWWVRPDLTVRDSNGFYASVREKLIEGDPVWFKNFIPMSVQDFDFLVERLTPYIHKKDTQFRKAISVGERLAVTLRYLATGECFSSLMEVFRLGKSTIWTIVHGTCAAICDALRDEFLKVPSSPAEWAAIADKFGERSNFPNCCGALDGKYIMFQTSNNNSVDDFDKLDSFVLLALADAEHKFTYVDVGAHTCGSDEIFAKFPLSDELAKNDLGFPPPMPLPRGDNPMPFVIVADEPFPMETYLMTPYIYRQQDMSHYVFNYRLSIAKRVIENVFGICAARFKILQKPIDVTPEKAKNIVLAICVLHNVLITRKSSNYAKSEDFDTEVNGELTLGNWRTEVGENGGLPSLQPNAADLKPSESAINVRTKFTEYFMTPPGELPWNLKQFSV